MGTHILYPSDLTDIEWQYLEPLLPLAKTTGRPRQWPLRSILNGIFYLIRSGCAWRMLPREYPPWTTVYDYCRHWRQDGTWERIHTRIRELVRETVGRNANPSGAVLDSQSVKTTDRGGPARGHTIGYDGFKKVKGRKRQLLVDTQGLVLKVKMTSAQLPERTGGQQLLEPLKPQFPRLKIVWADQGYTGDLSDWMKNHLGWRLEIVQRTSPADHKEKMWATARKRQKAGATVVEMWAGLNYGRGIEVLPRRWVVERTFAWLGKSRRLAKDYEFLPSTSEAMVYITMTRLMLRRLDKFSREKQP
jgi:transposase